MYKVGFDCYKVDCAKLALERSSVYQTTKVFSCFCYKYCSPFPSEVHHLTLIGWLIFEGVQLWLARLSWT